MDFIVEVLIELIVTIIVEGIAAGIAAFGNFVDENKKVKKIVKLSLVFSFFGLSIILFILSIIYKKTLFVIVSLIYMFCLLLTNLFTFINKNMWNNKKVQTSIKILKHIFYYTYPILLIILSILKLENTSAQISITILSILAIIIYFSIDMFKVYKKDKLKTALKKETEEKE